MHAISGTPRINEKWRGRFAYLCRTSAPRAIASAGYDLSAQFAARRIGKVAGVVQVDWVGRGVKDCHPGLSDIDLRITIDGSSAERLFEQLSSLRDCVLRLRAEVPWLGEVTLVNLETTPFLRELLHGALWDKRGVRRLFPERREADDCLPDTMTASRLGTAFYQYRLASTLFSGAFSVEGGRTLHGQRCRRLLEKTLWILGDSTLPTQSRKLSLSSLLDVVIAKFQQAAPAVALLPHTSHAISGRLLKVPVELQLAHDSAKKFLRTRVSDLEDSGLLGIFATADKQAARKSAELLNRAEHFPLALVPHSLIPLLQNGWGSFCARSFLFRTEQDRQSEFAPSRAWVSLLHRLALWESVWWGRWVSEPYEKLESVWQQATLVRDQLDARFLFPEALPSPAKDLFNFSIWNEEHLKIRETLRRELSEEAPEYR